MRRTILLVAILLILAGVAALYWLMRPLPVLTVTSWAGPYGRAQAAAQMRPYAAARRIDVHLAEWDGDLADLRKGDVVDMELPTAIDACQRGLLEKIDAAGLPPGDDGTPAARDFVPGAIGPCWVGSVVYSQAIIFAAVQNEPQPSTLADFFDTAKFPGRRALKRASAKLNLEMALLADGVAPADVYATLSTDAGVERALKKLATLDIVWWSADREPAAMIADGRAAFATILNGLGGLFDARSQHVIWDRQLYEMDAFGVPAGDAKKDMAMDFVRYATSSAPLAGVADWVPYGPARRSSWPLVGQNPDLHIAMKPWLPTSHFATAFAVNDAWWRAHGAVIEARWQAWAAMH